MQGVERFDGVVRSATASSPRPARPPLQSVGRAASIGLVIIAAGLLGIAPAHAAGPDGTTDEIGNAPTTDGSETTDIGTAPVPAGSPATTDIGTAPVPEDAPVVDDIGTPPLLIDLVDLGVDVVPSTPSPYVNHSFSWTVHVANSGTGSALGVVVTDVVPDQVTVIGVSSADFSCTALGNAVTCGRDGLGAGATGQITIDVMVPNSPTPQVVTNGASITSSSTDAVPANNSATSSVETVVVEVAPVAPIDPAAASSVSVSTLAEVAPAGPASPTAAATAPPVFADSLPHTGSNLQPLWLIAAEATLVGLGLLVVVRCPVAPRRR